MSLNTFYWLILMFLAILYLVKGSLFGGGALAAAAFVIACRDEE